MTAARNQRRPGFFWQGVLILLPVIVLAVVGLASLRQDERTAEEEARKRATENVRSMARTLGLSVDNALARFINLQSNWVAMARVAGEPGSSNLVSDAPSATNVANWERDYPGAGFAESVFPPALILTNGGQMDPPDFPIAPTPPQWLLELSPAQKTLWEHLRAAKTPEEIEGRQKAFRDSQPSRPAEDAAFNLFAPPESWRREASLTTDAGIYFTDIACYQMLSATHAHWTPELLRLVREQTLAHPSFMSSKLMAMAAGLPEPATVELQHNLSWTKLWWQKEAQVRTWLQSLRELPGLTTNTPNHQTALAHWVGRAEAEALALMQPVTITNSGAIPSSLGYRVWFVPRPMVEAVFRQAQNENKFLVPGYVHAVIVAGGRPLRLSQEATPIAEQSLLGTSSVSLSGDGGLSFTVKFYLTSREQMLAGERRREVLFGALILGAGLAALLGCLAAWRSFWRQWQLNEMKSNFVASVSHELRAPLASVRLMAENLERGKIPEPRKQNEYFRFIGQECRRLSSLIENVLDFSRIEQDRKQYEFEPTDLLALTRTTVKLMEPYVTEKGVALNCEVSAGPAGIHWESRVDGRAIQQALVNLIDNAVKHSPRGGMVTVGLKIHEASVSHPVAWHLYVMDHGPGIPADEQQKIFDRFYRLGSELQRETQGVGIGLSIVKHIMDAHGGKILVESAPGQGSRFTLVLPVKNEI